MFRMYLREGFAGQVHFVIPRPFLSQVENHPLLHALFPTDIGWYPKARFHYRERREGAPEHILIYCVDGSGSFSTGEQSWPVRAGDALLIPRDTPHTYSASLDDPWSIHWVHFRGETAYQFTQQLGQGQYLITVDRKAHTPIIETFQECYAALDSGFGMRQMIFCALSIHRILAWMFFGNPAFQSPSLTMPAEINKALTFMHDNLHRRLTLPEIAEHSGMSVSQFSFRFKTCMGVAPINYFLDLKIQYAGDLLLTTTMPVKEISFTIGYEDPYYFSRLFRRIMGTAPLNYRRRARHES